MNCNLIIRRPSIIFVTALSVWNRIPHYSSN
nr:MAG TPA: hypothetical protein [Caudoviricetes sp.]